MGYAGAIECVVGVEDDVGSSIGVDDDNVVEVVLVVVVLVGAGEGSDNFKEPKTD